MGEIVLYGKGKGYGKGGGFFDDPARRGPRRTVDYGSTVVRWLQECLVPRTSAQQLQCHYSFTRELMPPFATPRGPYDSICPRFVHAAANKTRAPVNVVHWFPHGRRLLSGTQTGEMTIWNGLQFHFENIMQAHNASIRAMQWTPEEHILVSGDQLGIIKFWDQHIYNFQTIQAHKEAICDIAVAPTGQKFVTCADDSHAKVWDLRKGEEERAFTGHGWDVKCCDWHPTKGLVATGSKDSQIKLWDPRASEAITTIYCHNSTVTKVAWSPHGQFLASGSRDQMIMLMDVRTMSVRKVFKGHTKEVTSLCWLPESEAVLASGGHEAAIHFWDTFGASTPLESVPGAHEGPIWSLAWHPLGHLLVSGSNDYSTRFWSRARPGDSNFADILPKKVALGANEAPVTIPDDLHVGTVFGSGIFAEPPKPAMTLDEIRAAAQAVNLQNAEEIAAAAAAERARLMVMDAPTMGLSLGTGANKKDVFDTSDFDAEDGVVPARERPSLLDQVREAGNTNAEALITEAEPPVVEPVLSAVPPDPADAAPTGDTSIGVDADAPGAGLAPASQACAAATVPAAVLPAVPSASEAMAVELEAVAGATLETATPPAAEEPPAPEESAAEPEAAGVADELTAAVPVFDGASATAMERAVPTLADPAPAGEGEPCPTAAVQGEPAAEAPADAAMTTNADGRDAADAPSEDVRIPQACVASDAADTVMTAEPDAAADAVPHGEAVGEATTRPAEADGDSEQPSHKRPRMQETASP